MTDPPVEPATAAAAVGAAADSAAADSADAAADPAVRPVRSHPFIRYTSARIALFVAAVVVVWLVRLATGVLLVIVALLISGLASFALLGRQRAEVSAALFDRRERHRARRLSAYEDEDGDGDGAGADDGIAPGAVRQL
jgi:hypothetical protein